ncbi:MAG: hypothetical protein E7051_07895 [Lentisphaerae bacterium]|nr:hypothetical protein [Lentisphaerota bacterium]
MTYQELLRQYDRLPRPDRSKMGFIRELEQFDLSSARKDISLQLNNPEIIPETALESLKRQFSVGSGGKTLSIIKDTTLPHEAFRVTLQGDELTVAASGDSGIRYGIYELEDLLKAGKEGVFERTPAIKHRITRSCFSPNSRPPLRLDELSDEVDYYPEAYLDRIAHERMNGVWITIYLNEMPSSFFPERDVAPGLKKLAKLQKVVDKCARYGIKCYLFCSEPKGFNNGGFKAFSAADLAAHPELGGHKQGNITDFCTSSEAGKAYLSETVSYIFSHVRDLGGMINIMTLEGSYPCGTRMLYPQSNDCNCQLCNKRTVADLFPEIARVFRDAIKKHQPDAEFFGWFYSAIHYPGEPENELRLQIAEKWPGECFLLYNCESGGEFEQSGKNRVVQDYSLSWAGPSGFWKEVSKRCAKTAAKIQTGCSHGDASVPYVPVPEILYERYQGLLESNCQAVMQCWYFGAYPGVMNRAAGRLSFLPFPENKAEFGTEICRNIWGGNAGKAAEAMADFARSAGFFPEALEFKWYGPLHHELVFPWHLDPVSKPLAPSYTLGTPVNSGDMAGECCDYEFTPAEIRTLLDNMKNHWQNGLDKLRKIAATVEQIKETCLAEFICLQISGTCRWFEFYRLRNEMIILQKDHRKALGELIESEIADSRRALELCERDPRLGYHAEVETYLIYPEKLRARIGLLQHLLSVELPHWDPDSPCCRRWRKVENALIAGDEGSALWQTLDCADYRIFTRERKLVFQFRNISGAKLSLNFLPGPSRRVLSCNLNYGVTGNWLSFPPGTEFFRRQDIAEIRFDLDFFSEFRHAPDAPYFFNLTVNGKSLAPRHDFEYRLWLTAVNPADLIAITTN